jgi:glutamate carboxypeptidase
MDAWLRDAAARIGRRAERELEALVAVSSPSGDRHGAEEAVAVAIALLPDTAEVERVPSSTPDHAPDLLARMRGSGSGRMLLLGHLDTVVGHDEHRPLERDGERLMGSGTVDMKGGDVLALGVMRELAQQPERFAEIALLLVCDEEWRMSSFVQVERFAGYDACLCFEAGELDPGGRDAVVVKRKAAGTVEVRARGRAAHSGSAPDKGRNALLALATAARKAAALHDPTGPDHLTVVPTVMRSGDALNIVPADGRLLCDVRADTAAAFERVIAALPAEIDEVVLDASLLRAWPGMDSRDATADLLRRASAMLGREIVGGARGGASDASHFAAVMPVTIDGLGPRGGGAHAPHEHVLARSLYERAEVALAVAAAALDGG